MAALIVRLDDEVLMRLSDLAVELDIDVNDVIVRLLDRDPHLHDHRCPTCVRRATAEQRYPDDQSLLDLLVT